MQRAQPAPSRTQAPEAIPIDAAIKRLQLALDTLETAELDNATARARRLEVANRDVAQRLEAAIETVRSVITAHPR